MAQEVKDPVDLFSSELIHVGKRHFSQPKPGTGLCLKGPVQILDDAVQLNPPIAIIKASWRISDSLPWRLPDWITPSRNRLLQISSIFLAIASRSSLSLWFDLVELFLVVLYFLVIIGTRLFLLCPRSAKAGAGMECTG